MVRDSVSSKSERIRRFFLEPKDFYYLTPAAALLGVSCRELIHEAQSDRPNDYREGRRWRFTWRQLAYVAFRTWTLAEIHGALGEDAARVLPPLLAMRRVTVTLPEFIVRAMETAAKDFGASLDEWLHHEMMDFAGTVTARMERVLPGYRRAYLFPGGDPSR